LPWRLAWEDFPAEGTAVELRFGTVAASLAHRGKPIGTFDTLIAAHALSLGLTLVTKNTQHFGRVVGSGEKTGSNLVSVLPTGGGSRVAKQHEIAEVAQSCFWAPQSTWCRSPATHSR
jgi:hypothetical protein